MIKFVLFLSLFFAEAHAFYGHRMKSYEASMLGHFYMKANSLDEANAKALSLGQLQTSFMIGSLYGTNWFGTRGTISKDFKISDLVVSEYEAGIFKVNYQLAATMLLEDQRELQNFSLSLPLYPEEAFAKPDTSCVINYWYTGAEFVYFQFWSPEIRGCKMVPGKDYFDYPVTLTERVFPTETYPRYEEMVHQGEVSFYYYFGSDFENLNRFGEAGKGFESIKFWLRKKKFSMVNDPNFSRTVSKFHRYEKMVGNTKIIIKIMLGNPFSNTPTAQAEYFWFMKEGYETGSFVQYTGHAGHGGIMDLTRLGNLLNSSVNFPQDRYQIYYLNGCQTYIYATNYFPQKKGGYKNLHLLGNGDVSWADNTWQGLEVFLNHFYDHFTFGTRMSYQDMIDESSQNMARILGRNRNTPMLAIEGDQI